MHWRAQERVPSLVPWYHYQALRRRVPSLGLSAPMASRTMATMSAMPLQAQERTPQPEQYFAGQGHCEHGSGWPPEPPRAHKWPGHHRESCRR